MNQGITRAEPLIPYLQLLDPSGTLRAPVPAWAADGSALLAMYRMMVRARLFDAKAVNLQRTGKLGTYPACLGHEATHVAVGAAMAPSDVLFPVYREISTQFWRGVTMKDVLLYWGGDERGTDYAQCPQDFPFCVPIGSQMPHAAGAALAFRIRAEARCAVAFIGDGGTSQGAFYEALNLAGVRKLPLVTIIVNNGWAISAPVSAQTACTSLAQKGVAAGVPGVQVDGNDVVAVRQVVGEALALARSGGGPTLIEAITYRLSDHTTSDDASRYRPASEVQAAQQLEPLIRTRRYLESRGLWSEAAESELRRACTTEIEEAVRQYLATPAQDAGAMFDFLYAKLPAHLQAQRDDARRYAAHH
jgi:2-oxoisovalerate dehydrogenase E1 component alpha subunit